MARCGSPPLAASAGISTAASRPSRRPTRRVGAVVPVLVEDDEGYIWVGVKSGAAMMRFHPREMDKVADPLRLPAGLHAATTRATGCSRARGCGRTASAACATVRAVCGWSTGPGMTIIDPRRLQRRAPPVGTAPRCRDRRRRAHRGRHRISSCRNGATLQIDYAALSLAAASKVRFRHMLTGVDADWIYDGDERQDEVHRTCRRATIVFSSARRTTGNGRSRRSGASASRRRSI